MQTQNLRWPSKFQATVDEKDIDRIEKAFRKFDTDNDGYIDRTEFEQVARPKVINDE